MTIDKQVICLAVVTLGVHRIRCSIGTGPLMAHDVIGVIDRLWLGEQDCP